MRVVGMVGSKRKNGNTARLVAEALAGAEAEGATTEIVFLGDLSIEGCSGCEGCRDTFKCTVDDDMQRIYPMLLQADGLLLGSPTYFHNVTADMKALIDRCYSLFAFDDSDRFCWMGMKEALGGGCGVAIAVCEQHEEEQIGFTAEALTTALAELGFRPVDTVKAVGFFGPRETRANSKQLERSRQAGQRLVKTLKLREYAAAKLRQGDRQGDGSSV